MKRFWIGAGLLVGLLIVSFWTMTAMDQVHSSISDSLDHSAQAAQAEQWRRADKLADDAESEWKKNWRFSAAMADHTALDEIDSLFAQAEVYRKNRESIAYAAACARLSQLIEALQEGHQLSWWNLL